MLEQRWARSGFACQYQNQNHFWKQWLLNINIKIMQILILRVNIKINNFESEFWLVIQYQDWSNYKLINQYQNQYWTLHCQYQFQNQYKFDCFGKIKFNIKPNFLLFQYQNQNNTFFWFWDAISKSISNQTFIQANIFNMS